VTHLAVHGTLDTAPVLSYLLLIKKIERIGDQVKNILDMTDEGVDLSDAPDVQELTAYRRTISNMIGEVADLMADHDEQEAAEFRERADALKKEIEQKIREYMHSDEPGHVAVPRAILYRYWKRIVANLGGVISSITEPLQHQDYYDEGATDIED
jgi:phosphate uptake regulator